MEIAGALAGESEIDAILELVAKRGRALVGARILAIEIQEGAELAVAAGAGELPSDFVGRRFAIQETVASTALRTRRTQRLSDELNRSRFEQHGLGRFDLQVSDGLVVPMIFRGEPYGVLLALDRYGGPAFEPDQERLLEAFASSAAVVVATARSAADERRRQVMAAAEAERGRWARELHDETLQAIASVRLMLSAARRVTDAEEMRASIEAAMDELQTDMDNLRALITDLRPGALDQLGIEPALIDLTERVGASGIDLDVNIDLSFEQGRADRRLAPDLETAIYRTVQEALTNVAKHAGADRAVVEVVEDGATVSVRIRDNGRGFDPHDETEGFGLLGMQERVELVDGHLTVDSSAGRGTTVTAEFPVRRRARPTPARAAG